MPYPLTGPLKATRHFPVLISRSSFDTQKRQQFKINIKINKNGDGQGQGEHIIFIENVIIKTNSMYSILVTHRFLTIIFY